VTFTPQAEPPAVPAGDRTRLYGVLGIIGAVGCQIAGIIFGFLCITESRKAGKSPVLGYVAIVLSVVCAIGLAIMTIRISS